MAFTITWNEATPAGTDNMNEGDDAIRNFKTAVRERMAEEHFAYADESGQSFVWEHKPQLRRTAITQADTPYTLLDSDFMVNIQASSALNVALPACSGQEAGRVVWFHGQDVSGGVTLTPDGSDNLNGANSALGFFIDGEIIAIYTDQSAWYVFSWRIPISKNLTEVSTSGTGEDDLMSFTIPANSLGSTGGVRVRAAGRVTGTNDTKDIRLYLGATELFNVQQAAAHVRDWGIDAVILNDGATNAQKATTSHIEGAAENPKHEYETAAIDTTADAVVKVTGECANASDAVINELLVVEKL